ncbi:MAG: L-aspartate oxidase [Planctomycetales bacterium]|nr:L-aspartate oxidase [Planctomycetales bacterium]
MPTRQTDIRRYLVPVYTASTPQLFTDCLVIGCGIAGLRAALEAAPHCNVTLVCKGAFSDSNTWNAQGGIASVLDEVEDSFEAHIEDTLRTGCGLGDKSVIEQVVREGPGLVRQLADWGTAFDRTDGEIDISLEGGHSHARIAHSHGDSTGRGIAETLINRVRQTPSINVLENFFAIDLLTDDSGECVGVIGQRHSRSLQIIWAAATILATGGAGRLYRETTNPECATADGLAMAWRAGAVLRDMEFMQFHPTTLYIAGASRALVTETLRGEGAILRDINHEPFMKEYDSRGELAPRDVVSQAILDRMLKTRATHVYLDIRHFDKAYFQKRFPLISELCESFDINVSTDLIPVRPSAHYMIGGVKTDIHAATSIRRLFACGEAASTGLNGANRLGSNSLLEGLVFGRLAGRSAVGLLDAAGPVGHRRMLFEVPPSDRSRLDAEDVRNSLRSLMWRNVGITRSHAPLQEAMETIRFWQQYVMDKVFASPFGWECQNMLTAALLITHAAQERKESRGVHCRQDFPARDDTAFARHIELVRQ